MRSFVLRKRRNNLFLAVSVGAVSIMLSACSSGFQRFDSSFYEDAVPQQTSGAINPYPDSVDPVTTASVGSRLAPAANVGLAPVPQGVYHQPEPTYAAPQQVAPQYTPPAYDPPQRQSLDGYSPRSTAPSWGAGTSIKSTELAAPKISSTPATPPAAARPSPKPLYEKLEKAVQAPAKQPAPKLSYSAPEPAGGEGTVYIPEQQTDNFTTAAIEPQVRDAGREAGWTAAGGTAITVREGETLYNLSKRYGVPVDAIRKANAMGSADSIRAGQRIVIPTYVYGPSVAVSAPDNNPETRASKAGIGYIGEAVGNSVAVPSPNPGHDYYAAVSPTGDTEDQQRRRYQPKTHSAPPDQNNTPDYGVTTSSLGSSGYTVQPGDTLGAIAAKTGVSVAAIQAANNLTGTGIRAGQTLNIPGVNNVAQTAQNTASPIQGVDPLTTGSVSSPVAKSASEVVKKSEEIVAPKATGIENFRWPVKGRIIEAFGARNADGTNDGIDISVPEGTAVRAAENGVVIYAGSEISEYGNLILVRHSDDWVSAYAHNRDFEVKKGEHVSRGQIIARSGKTGATDLPKLHFELRKHSRPVNPVDHLAGT